MADIENKRIMAENITYYMAYNGITRTALAKAIGAPYTTVCSWLQMKFYPRIDMIESMAKLFGIKKSNLIEERKQDDEEKAFIEDYRSLTEKEQRQVRNFLARVKKEGAL